ncbi:MAG: hypothetical protein U0L92_04740, partial [Clostridia bacterium]|nr:hypothetical protein [Clostridia bacterium]
MKTLCNKQLLYRIVALCLTFSVGMGLIYIPTGYGVSLSEVFLDEGFNTMQSGTEPENFECSGDGGSVTVEEYEGELCVYVKNDSDGRYIMLQKTLSEVATGLLHISFDFLQPLVQGDSVLLSLYENNHEFAKVYTENGKMYFGSENENTEVLSEYATNCWYSLSVEVNLGSGTAQVAVDGEVRIEGATFTNNSASCDKLCFYTNYSPGFYIDNLFVSEQTNMDKIIIEGPEIVTIPEYGFNEYEFSAYLPDKNGNAVQNTPLKWEIINNVDNAFSGIELIQMDEYGMKMVLSVVADTTFRGIVKLKVTYVGDGAGENPPETYYTVALEKQKVRTMEISGSARITTGLDRNERQYQVVAKDPYGKVINKVDSTWYLAEGTPSYVSIDTSGVLTLSKEVSEDTHVTVYAKVKDSDVIAEKTVVLQNQKNYWNDVWRLQVLQSAVDQVIEYGKDPYSSSPLLASGIDLRTKLPVEWKQSLDSEPAAFSNLAFDTGLYMVFDVLSELVDDPKYTEKVD